MTDPTQTKPLVPALSMALWAGFTAPLVAQETVIIGTAFPYAPFITRAEDGAPAGAEAELLSLICTQAGWTCDWTELAFDDLIPALQDGRIDIAANGLGHTPERAVEVHMACPYYPVLGDPPSGTFFVTDPSHDPLSGPIGVTAGSLFEATLLREGLLPVPFADEATALQALLDGLVPAHFGSSTFPAQIGLDDILLSVGELPTGAIGFAFALAPSDTAFIEAFEDAQENLSANGILAGVVETHLGFSHADPISLCDRSNPIS